MGQKFSSKKMTLILGFFTACSRVLGFFRQIVFVKFFGAGELADIFNFAFNIPNNLRKLLAEGALSSAYIPEISASLIEDPSRKRASQVVRTVLTFQMAVLIPLMILMVSFAEPIVGFLSEFDQEWKTQKAIELFRFLIFYLLLVSLSAILMASLNSISKFVIPALTPILFSVAVIGSVALLHRFMGLYSMIFGVLLGGIAQILFQLPLFLKSGFSVKPLFQFRSPEFLRIMKRYVPVVASSGIFMALQTFAHFLGSLMEEGSISSLANSMVIWQLPFGIFSVSIMTVLFPRMSRQSHSGDIEGVKSSIEEGLSGFLAFIVPSSLFLYFGAELIVSAIYYRGEFSMSNVTATAEVLKAYSVGIFSVSAFQFIQRYFYASHSYRIPFAAAAAVALLDVLFSVFFYQKGVGAPGLAWANTIAYSAGFVALWFAAALRLGGIRFRGLVRTFIKVAVSLMPMLGLMVMFNLFWGELWQDSRDWLRLGILSALALACIFPVLSLYLLLKVEVFSDIITSRFRRKK